MLRERLISAAIMIAVILSAILVGGRVLNLTILVGVFVCLCEAFAFSFQKNRNTTLILAVAGILPAIGWLSCGLATACVAGIAGLIVVFGMTLWEIERGEPADNLDAAVPMLSSIYVWVAGFGTCLLVAISQIQGSSTIIWFITVVALSDTGAYFAGRSFGKNKLAPTISPGKTIEGSIGGLLLAIVGGLSLAECAGLQMNYGAIALLCGAISLMTQLGDLVQSMFKRAYDVKDSGNWIPGHGGLLDRVDGLLIASPLMLFLLG